MRFIFQAQGIRKFYYDGTSKGIQVKHAEKLANILDLLDAADTIQVMNMNWKKKFKNWVTQL